MLQADPITAPGIGEFYATGVGVALLFIPQSLTGLGTLPIKVRNIGQFPLEGVLLDTGDSPVYKIRLAHRNHDFQVKCHL